MSVAGENVRADKGTVDGKEVLLVPLIKTKPGDAYYDVILVYRNPKADGLGTFSRESLEDPEVVDVTVERTLWDLYVPEGSTAGRFGGNMERTLDEVNKIEKLQGRLEEVRGLNSDLYNARDAVTAQNAEANYKQQKDEIEQQLKQVAPDQDHLYAEPGDSEYVKQQGKAVAAQKREITKALEDEEKANEGNLSKAQEFHDMTSVGQVQPITTVTKNGADTQVWTGNGSFKPAAKEADEAGDGKKIDKQTREGNQIYVNDYVVNLQGVNTYSGSTTVNGGVVTAGATTVSGANGYNGGTMIAAGGAGNLALTNAATANNAPTSLNGGAGSGVLVQNKVSEIQSQQAMVRRAVPATPPESRRAECAGSTRAISIYHRLRRRPDNHRPAQRQRGDIERGD